MSNFLYNPDQKNKKQLIAEFVVRTEILDDIMSDIESSDMSKPEQHYLLVGQRGTGKTTLLLRIKYAVEDSEKLKDWLIPINFSEEQYNITELANLWESVAHVLEDYHGFNGISDEMEQHINKTDFEELCYDILERELEAKNKKIVLLIDNVGDLLKKLEPNEVRRLREILQTKKYLRLIAGSPFYLESILDYTQPFFEFFKVQRLDGLNKSQAEQLLLKLGEVHNEKETIERIIKETPERIETLRILTGGVPRTIGLMFRIFVDYEHENSMKDLERILDAVTPLYKHRMDDLPTQQQKIVDAVARNWDAISVKDLKSRVRLESKTISAQLRQLEKNQIIETRETSTKNHLYLLKERFWNIWYLMRYGRKTDSERVQWLVHFLESWCTNDDFEKRISNYVNQIADGKLDEETAAFYGHVYASLKTITADQKYRLKKNTPENVGIKINITEEEAVELAKEYSEGNNHFEAIKVLLEVNKLSFRNKAMLGVEFYNLYSTVGIDKLQEIVKDNNLSGYYDKGGMLTYILEVCSIHIVRYLVTKDYEHETEMIEALKDVLNGVEYEMDFEYLSMGKLITLYLAFERYETTRKIFDDLERIKIKEKLSPHYYALIYLSESSKAKELNGFGDEIREASKVVLERIEELKRKLE